MPHSRCICLCRVYKLIMTIKEVFKSAARHIFLKSLRNTFFGVVMLSETVSPYHKLGMGIVLILQPVNIPGPVDGLFYLGLLVDGSRGIYKDIKGHLTGEKRRQKIEFKRQCLQASFERSDTHHLKLAERPAMPVNYVTTCNTL